VATKVRCRQNSKTCRFDVTEREHVPVLRDEVLEALAVRPEGAYVDATFGRGGHAEAILRRLNDHGRLIALDRDPLAVEAARRRFAHDARLAITHSAFSGLGDVVTGHGLSGRIDGVLFDLGVSSPQLDDPARGFSFRFDAPLDMRMDTTRGESAAQWLARADEEEIARVIYEYGEERFSRRIARAIVRERAGEPIATTGRLANIVRGAVRTRERGQHPATRTFQAIRIFINDELGEIERALPQALAALTTGGRLAVISFHSLEDRVVKNFFREQEKGPEYPPELPVVPVFRPRLRALGKPVRPGEEETRRNARARSAILRVAERTEVPA
jgi:16S rRNA (cytosine1402-N4)-methyltransferase